LYASHRMAQPSRMVLRLSRLPYYTFNTTQKEEEKIKQNIEKGGCNPGFCAVRASEVLSGIGPFKNLPSTKTPIELGQELSKIQNPTK